MWAAGALVTAVVLGGCAATPSPTPPGPSPTRTAATPQPAPTDSGGPTLHPDGSAQDNLALFTAVTVAVWQSADRSRGLAYIDALTAAGFDRAAMQVTADTSTIGNPAESLQFSVLWSGECLVGQVGEATGEPVTAVLPALAGGSCLVGRTQPID